MRHDPVWRGPAGERDERGLRVAAPDREGNVEDQAVERVRDGVRADGREHADRVEQRPVLGVVAQFPVRLGDEVVGAAQMLADVHRHRRLLRNEGRLGHRVAPASGVSQQDHGLLARAERSRHAHGVRPVPHVHAVFPEGPRDRDAHQVVPLQVIPEVVRADVRRHDLTRVGVVHDPQRHRELIAESGIAQIVHHPFAVPRPRHGVRVAECAHHEDAKRREVVHGGIGPVRDGVDGPLSDSDTPSSSPTWWGSSMRGRRWEARGCRRQGREPDRSPMCLREEPCSRWRPPRRSP